MAPRIEAVPLSVFAKDWGVTIRTVQNWAAAGMPTRTVDGERRVVRSDANAWLRAKAEADATAKAEPADADEAKARKLAAEARLAELELAQREGVMVTVEDAARVMEEKLAPLRSALVTLPQRVAPQVMGCKTVGEVTGKLSAAVAEAMTSIAEGA